MEPSQTGSVQEQMNVMVTMGIDRPIETMIRDYPYLVLLVEIRVCEIFVLLGYNFFDQFKLIRLPQRLHEPFKQLLIISRLNGVDSFFIEYAGNKNDGEPILRAYSSGFSTFV